MKKIILTGVSALALIGCDVDLTGLTLSETEDGFVVTQDGQPVGDLIIDPLPDPEIDRPNILFVTIDDLLSKDAWPLYADVLQTPNLDRLMKQSQNFTQAFSDVAICNPSRASLLTGRTAWSTGVIGNTEELSHHVDLATQTLPGVLKGSGYTTYMGGKVFHGLADENLEFVASKSLDARGLRNTSSNDGYPTLGNGSVQYGVTPDVLADDTLAVSVAQALTDEDGTEPFAIFAGIYRPHVDLVIPQEFADIYAGMTLPVPDFLDETERSNFANATRGDFHQSVVTTGQWEDGVRYYLASASYADAKLGEMLNALQNSAHADTTHVVVASDHGFHLGDGGRWHKFTLYEQAARVPFMMRLLGETAKDIDQPVNLSGVMATVLDLAEIEERPQDIQPSLTKLIAGSTDETYAVTWMQESVSVRSVDYRYSRYGDGSEELFHIPSDIYNEVNLIGTSLPAEATLRTKAEEALEGVHINPGSIFGGFGDDNYFFDGAAADILQESGGIDTVFLDADYVLPNGIENADGTSITTAYVFTGNDLDNRLTGANQNDTLSGGAGNDRLYGFIGDDALYGGDGDDDISGGSGDDTIYGGIGNDRILGNHDEDRLYGEDGDDFISGGAHRDYIVGGNGEDTLIGGEGNDILSGQGGKDTLNGGGGWDTLNGGGSNDTAVFSGNSTDYYLVSGAVGYFIIQGPDDRAFLNSIEVLQFDDGTFTAQDWLNTQP